MAKGLGARVIALEAPFNPEGGAYVKAEGGDPAAHQHGHHHGAITITIIAITSSDHGHHDHDHAGLRSSRP